MNLRNAETISQGQFALSDNATPQVEGESTIDLTINPHTPHRIVFSGASTGVADNETHYSLTIESRDQYGNPVATSNAADSSLDLIAVREDGYPLVGP